MQEPEGAAPRGTGTTQAALPRENALVIRVELRGLEPLTTTLPGRRDRVHGGSPPFRQPSQIKRRTDVVGWGHLPLAGDFPNPEALLRLAGAVLVEAHDEWQVADRRYLSEGSMALLNRPEPDEEVAQPAVIAS